MSAPFWTSREVGVRVRGEVNFPRPFSLLLSCGVDLVGSES